MEKNKIQNNIGTKIIEFESKKNESCNKDNDKENFNYSDEELIEIALKGNKWAYEMLVQSYYKQIYRIAYRILNDSEDALDATQEVFLRVYNSLNSFEKRSSFKTWIYKIAINTCITYNNSLNKLKKVAWDKICQWLPILKWIEPSNYVIEKEYKNYIHNLIMKRISNLPEIYRIPVILKDVEGISIEEISEILDIPLGTVKSRLNRGRRILQEELEPLLVEEN